MKSAFIHWKPENPKRKVQQTQYNNCNSIQRAQTPTASDKAEMPSESDSDPDVAGSLPKYVVDSLPSVSYFAKFWEKTGRWLYEKW